ncbi:MAG TPA: YchJ family protein [Kofleriaceae bacterium]|nr:YchJ family protein [Kofleriaceae bacterium]
MAEPAKTHEKASEPCPCGAGPSASACCLRYITGAEPAPTAEALMRSRYSAYALGEIPWILATHDPSSTEEVDEASTEKWSKEATWKGLEIVSTAAGGPDDEAGEVEFIARYEMQGHPFSHHERARFRKVEGRWYYADGDMVKPRPVVREQPKVGRNDPCPCGSGQKYKKCHGAA